MVRLYGVVVTSANCPAPVVVAPPLTTLTPLTERIHSPEQVTPLGYCFVSQSIHVVFSPDLT